MELIYFLSMICILLIILIFLMTNFKWIIKELRWICKNESGYIKLIQLVFIMLIFGSFFILLIYNIFYRELTSKLDIFLTVIVGLIGTIVGTFFSERIMESIKEDREKKKKKIIEKKQKLREYKELLDKLKRELS